MSEHDDQTSLKDLMNQSGLTQKYIAQKADVSPAAISLIVNRKSKSRRIEDLIRKEAAKALEKQNAKNGPR